MSNRLPVAVVVCLGAILATACSQASPAAPGAVPTAGGASGGVAETDATFLLAEGTLVLTSRKGTISGRYTGEAADDGSATLTIVLTGGTRHFDGVSGTLSGAGRGAFTGEGDFSLVLHGIVSTTKGTRQTRVSLRGTASLSCSGEIIVVTQSGEGTVSGIGKVTAALTHQIASGAGCSSD